MVVELLDARLQSQIHYEIVLARQCYNLAKMVVFWLLDLLVRSSTCSNIFWLYKKCPRVVRQIWHVELLDARLQSQIHYDFFSSTML